MTEIEDRNLKEHFSFRQNWSDYSEIVEERHIISAEKSSAISPLYLNMLGCE